MRIDVDGRDGTASVWVTAARIGDAEAAVIVQMRQGLAGDRRKRTEVNWMGGPRLRVHALGRTRLEAGRLLGGEWLGHRPGEILRYLLCHRSRTVSTEELPPAHVRGGPRPRAVRSQPLALR